MKPGITLLIGRRGSGKSRYARYLVREGAKLGYRYIVHDPMADWLAWGDDEAYPKGVEIYADRVADDVAQIAVANAPCTLVYDELREALPTVGKPSPITEDIVSYGRHMQVGLIGCTQRPSLISASVRALATYIVIFKITNSRDLQWLRENCDDSIAEIAPRLADGQFVVWPSPEKL